MTDSSPTSSLQLRSLVTEQGMLELSLVDVPIPSVAGDEVLVRIEAAPINPSDLGLLLAGADLAAAVVADTAERPVVTAPLADGALRVLTGRVGKSLAVGNEGAGTVVADGAVTNIYQAAALGFIDLVRTELAAEPAPDAERVTAAFWAACGSGNRDIAELLLNHGAAINWLGWGDKTALDQARDADENDLAAWLESHGAKPATELAD